VCVCVSLIKNIVSRSECVAHWNLIYFILFFASAFQASVAPYLITILITNFWPATRCYWFSTQTRKRLLSLESRAGWTITQYRCIELVWIAGSAGRGYYTALPMHYAPCVPLTASLERLVPRKGYTPENVVLEVAEANLAWQWSRELADALWGLRRC
jgi:hypothetical protein